MHFGRTSHAQNIRNTVDRVQKQWKYYKFPKTLYTKVSDKMAYANIADPDRTIPMSSLITIYIACHTIKYFKKQLHKKAKFRQKSMY